MKSFWQVFAIARTEIRFALRRSAPVVVTVFIGLVVGAGLILLPISAWSDWDVTTREYTPEQVDRLAEEGYTPDSYQLLINRFSADWFSASGALMAWNMMSMALILLPIATVSLIPADRKYNVLEIIRSTPTTGAKYLAGKILGIVTIVLLTGLAIFLVFLSVLEGVMLSSRLHLSLSPDTLLYYFQLFLMDGLPVLACSAVIGVLVGVLFRTRRGALFPGFLAGLLSFFFWLTAFKPPSTNNFPIMDVASYYVLQNYHTEAITKMLSLTGLENTGLFMEGAPVIGIWRVILMYVTLLVVFILLTLLARLWLRWKENF